MDYKQKLIKWNSTEKYFKEVQFLKQLLSGYDGKILDYGCGLGTTSLAIGADGYDRFDYTITPSIKYLINYKQEYTGFPVEDYSQVYFMHSLAHIESPEKILQFLKFDSTRLRITVITPNAEWLDKDYIGDETVIKHYTQKELKELFESCGYRVTLLGQFGEYKEGKNERIFLQAICEK